jgi:hypothetical protein
MFNSSFPYKSRQIYDIIADDGYLVLYLILFTGIKLVRPPEIIRMEYIESRISDNRTSGPRQGPKAGDR